MKFCMVIDDNHNSQFCTNYFLHVKVTNMPTMGTFEVMYDKFKLVGMCRLTSKSYVQKLA
jgi:hypothetical protein